MPADHLPTPEQSTTAKSRQPGGSLLAHPLTAADLAMFARFRVGPELLTKANISRLTDAETREILSLNGAFGDMAGIVFPYISPHTGSRVTARVRRDHPEIEDGREKNKYMCAYGDRRHLYAVAGSEALLADLTVPAILVEAEKSALAIWSWSQRTAKRFLPIAMGGCYGWRGRIGKTEDAKGHRVDELGPLPDLEWCRNRRTYILLDSNCGTNPKVQAARRDLVRALVKLEADARILNLPPCDGVNGPDDFLAAKGDAALTALLETDTAATAPVVWTEDGLTIELAETYPDLRYVDDWKRWMKYTSDGVWRKDNTRSVFARAKGICRDASVGISAKDAATLKWLRSAKTRAAVENMAREMPEYAQFPINGTPT